RFMSLTRSNMQTLDPSLQHLHWMHTNFPDSPHCVRRGKDAPVFVKFTGAPDSLVNSGLRELSVISHPAYDFSLAMGRIEILRLPELAQQQNVLLVEPSVPMRPLLNKALPKTHANLVHQGTPSFKGAGVIVGIIDTGIDFLHQNFRTGTNGSESR